MAAVEYQSPYVGLIAYSESDSARFFGRDREVRLISANFHASSLMLLYGESGVGKSSVLRAGIIHRLNAREDLLAILFSSWQGDPVSDLKRAVTSALHSAGYELSPPSESSSLAAFLSTCARQLERRLMIVLDQFEEFFLYHPSECTFDSEFPLAVMQTDAPVNFLISLREEFYARLDRFEGVIPTLYDNNFRLEHLDREAAREAIVAPLRLHMISIEPELVRDVIEQVTVGQVMLGETERVFVSDSALHARIETPFLQMVMTRLWLEETRAGSRVLRRGTLDKLGGAKRIVSTHLDEVMGALSTEEQEVAASILHYLVTPSGTKISIAASDLSVYTGVPIGKLEHALDYLTNPSVRILRTITSEASPHADLRYEIFHDVLGPAILDWRTRYLREREKAAFLHEAQLSLAKERQKAKRRAFYLICTTSLLILLLFSIGYVNMQRYAALQATTEAEKQKAEAQKLLDIVAKLDQVVPYFKAIMRGHNGIVNNAVFSPDARMVLTASSDGTARVWETETGRTLFELQGHSRALSDAAFSPDGKLIATASSDNTARLWNAESGRSLAELKGHTNAVNDVVFSPDARYVATSSTDGTARVWNTATGQPIVVLTGHSGSVNQVAFSPDGQQLVTASDDGTARLWDTTSGNLISEMKGHQNAVYSVAFSPSGKMVLTASADRTAKIWDSETGHMITSLKGHTDAVLDAAFSPDGKFVVTASLDKTAIIWDAATGRSVKLSGHTAEVLSAAFSPDGLRVITASADRTARVWETDSGRELAELRGHIAGVKDAIFSPGGDLVVTASEDTTARVWDVVEAGGLRIKDVSLKVISEVYKGPCPVTISLIGRISVEGMKGQVKYRFVRANESVGAERVLNFDSPGTKEVSMRWKFGGSLLPEPSGSFYLQTLAPQEVRSAEASYRVRCENLK